MKVTLSDSEATMLLPLLSRAIESKKKDPVFFDPLAVSVVENIDYDLGRLKSEISDYSSISWSARALQFANITTEFIHSHSEATIVNLGAGLDTTFYIVDDGKIKWFNVDSEAVNELRNTLLPANTRITNISGNVLDPNLFERIMVNTQNVLFIASGLLLYLTENEIKVLFKGIADRFLSCTIVFDRISAYSIQYVQTDLNKSNLNKAKIQWGIDNVKEIENWDSRFKIVREVRMFERIAREKIGKAEIIKLMDLNDQYNGSGIAILECGSPLAKQP
jgi:O-methyltransferase involved in polyketide biosynthesis